MTMNVLLISNRFARVALHIVCIALVIYLAGLAARLTWFFVSPEEAVQSSSTVTVAKPNKTKPEKNLRLDAIELFGRVEVVKEAPVPVAVEAPKTHLRLVLEGVFTASEQSKAGAIISEKGRDAQYYSVGQSIPGDATLNSVFPDHVLIERKGRLEKLSFEEENQRGSDIKQVARPTPQPPSQNISTPEQFVEQAHARLAENPVNALASVGLVPVTEGGASGYVFNGNNPMLSGLNLKKGDVIRSVNGHALGDIEQDKEMLKEMSQQNSLEVEVEREGTSFYVNYPLRR